MKSVIVGTAGHIDHGKSSLVKALTGTDPDRWEEERRRGITIDLGFAHRAVDAVQLAFVDVPGHERFVKNMLAGAGGIDLVLFVIAADESIKPQTREHFDICRLLGVQAGVIALTKTDLVDAEMLGLVKMEVEEFTAGSFLAGAPMLAVSSVTGAGLDTLLAALSSVAARVRAKDVARPFRLPIDRAFTMRGFGTVVTGTMMAGTLDLESEVEIYPVGRRARVRGLQVHGAAVARASAGQRTAVNLAGVDVAELARGMALASPGRFRATTRCDARLHLLPSARTLKNHAPAHFHSGTAECVTDVQLLHGAAALQPGDSALVRLRLHRPVLLLPGDRFILRQFSPVTTIGGGVALDIQPGKVEAAAPLLSAVETGDRRQILSALLAPGQVLTRAELLARTGWSDQDLDAVADQAVVIEGVFVHPQRFADLQAAIFAEVQRFHAANPLTPGIAREELRGRVLRGPQAVVFEGALSGLVAEGKLETAGEMVRQAGRQVILTGEEAAAREQILAAFEKAGLLVPPLPEVLGKLPVEPARARKILQLLLKEGALIRVTEDLLFHRGALQQLRRLLTEYKSRSNRLNVGTFKDLTGVTRKYAIPLLEYLDRERVTRRVGDERVLL